MRHNRNLGLWASAALVAICAAGCGSSAPSSSCAACQTDTDCHTANERCRQNVCVVDDFDPARCVGGSSSASGSASGSSAGATAGSSGAGSTSSGSSASSSSGSAGSSGSSASASSSGSSTGASSGTSGGFQTSLVNGMTITPPYAWTFTPGVTAVQGSFWADGTRLATVTGAPPYAFTITDGLLSDGPHTLGHSWDLADGGHFSPPNGYRVTVQNSADAGDGGSSAGSDGGSGAGTDGGYEAAIAYTQTRPPFTPTRTVVVTSQSQLQSAINNLQPGDLVDCQGAFTVSGEFTISNQLSATAVIDFKTGANAVKFVGPAGQNLPAVYIPNASNIRFYGGDLSTQDTGGGGILIHGGDHILWWGFYIHDCGGTGLSMFTDAAITNCDMQGEITEVGLNTAWDPHAEKGTGIHGANLADGNAYSFANNRVALYVHDQPSGAAIELGENSVVPSFTGNKIYLKAVNLTKVATEQTAGNAIQLWGAAGLGVDIEYIEAENCQGRAVDGEGFDASTNGSGVIVHQGFASNVCLNTNMNESGIPVSEPWDTRWGITYENVSPPP